jgi:hypothetical protein
MDRRAMTSARRRPVAALATLVAGGVVLAACGSGGPSVASRVAQSASTTSTAPASTTTTTGSATTTTAPPTTTTTAVPANLQLVTYSGLTVEVPKDWPVYDLAADQRRCVRLDVHALYLGQQGPTPQCPATVIGHTDTAQIEPLDARTQGDAVAATKQQVLNGLNVRVDPTPQTSGAYTIVFTDLQLVAIVTVGNSPALDQQIVASFQHAR